MEWYNLVSLSGLATLPLAAWLLSGLKRPFPWRTVVAGTILQLAFGLFLFVSPVGSQAFLFLSKVVTKVISASFAGAQFCFGVLSVPMGQPGSLGFNLVFQGFPAIIFFTMLMEILYHIRLMPFIIRQFSWLFTKLMRVSGVEGLCASSNIFVGIEALATIRPYLERMTPSEACTIMTAGLATIASSVLGLYALMLQAQFPNIAAHLISASLLSAPAALVMTKIMLPETGRPETLGLHVKPHYERHNNIVAAIIAGANAGGRLVLGVIVLLIAVISLVALVNMGLDWIGRAAFGTANLRLENLLAYLFYPFALLIGVPPADAMAVGKLLGERIIMTEIPAYQHLGGYLADGVLHHGRSAVLAAYALCGFAHVASVAILVGGVVALAPNQTRTMSEVAWRALVAATLACLMTAAVAGAFYGKGIMLLTSAP